MTTPGQQYMTSQSPFIAHQFLGHEDPARVEFFMDRRRRGGYAQVCSPLIVTLLQWYLRRRSCLSSL